MSRSSVTVLGSANADLVLGVDRFPRAGETLLAGPRGGGAGGKGLNQAVAAARAGARTRFVGALGADPEGVQLRRVLAGDGIEGVVRTTGAPTGLAVVMVDAAGENAIVVSPGANGELTDLTPVEVTAIEGADVLLMQLEVPQATVAAAARVAKDASVLVVLNAAPAATLDPALLTCVDVLVVNEGEARQVAAGVSAPTAPGAGDSADQLTERLLALVPAVVITLGPEGALYGDRTGARHRQPGRPVAVTDTTGAGDTFAGYLAAALADKEAIPVALDRANAAAALCVQRAGAVRSVPSASELDG